MPILCPLVGLLFAALTRFLVTLPATWFVYAFLYTITRCEPFLSLRCVEVGLGAPVGMIVMLGLAVEETYDEPDCAFVWLVAGGIALLWAMIDAIVESRRKGLRRR